MSQTVSGLDLQSLALGLDLKLKICECDMSLQTVESEMRSVIDLWKESRVQSKTVEKSFRRW